MKTPFLFLILLAPLSAFSTTEILENTSNGSTFIDPMNEMARINFSTTYKDANIAPTYKCSKYIMVKRQNDKGEIVTEKSISESDSCDSLKQAGNNFVACKEYGAMVMTIDDPKTCGQPAGACQELSSPTKGSLDIRLSSEKFKQDLKACSPEELLIIKDTKTNRGALSSLKDKSHCGLDKKQIFTGENLWKESNPKLKEMMQIKTSDKPGFYIGDHTHYFFDYSKNQWCIHFKPELPSTAPTCGYTDITKPIAFVYPSMKLNKGAVKLGIEDGKPVAYIGQPQSSEYTKNPTLKTDSPVLKVSLVQDSTVPGGNISAGRRTIFEMKDSMNGSTTKTLTVAPTYSLGQRFGTPGTCGASSCLRTPVEVSGEQGTDKLYCKNNSEDLSMTDGSEDLCYSCNGVSSGTCGSQTTLISKSGKKVRPDDTRNFLAFDKVLNDLKSCKSTPDIIQEPATVDQ